jgi:hypothetical protein
MVGIALLSNNWVWTFPALLSVIVLTIPQITIFSPAYNIMLASSSSLSFVITKVVYTEAGTIPSSYILSVLVANVTIAWADYRTSTLQLEKIQEALARRSKQEVLQNAYEQAKSEAAAQHQRVEELVKAVELSEEENRMIEELMDEQEMAAMKVWQVDTTHVKIGRVLGRGAFGVVCKAEYRGQTCAVKLLQTNIDEGNIERFREEIKTMASLHHPFLLRMIGASWNPNVANGMMIVMETRPIGWA